MPKLSIITINLNNKEKLKRTIKSVIAQTCHDYEYIVIDGDSTDGSVEIIRQYEDRITYWESEPDRGIYHAMNKGILKATGEYCQFLNSGDWLTTDDVVEKMLAALPGCSIFYGNMLKILPNNKIYQNKKINVDSMLTFYNGSLNHSSAFIKRSLFETYGLYDESLKIVSDWKFYFIAIGLHQEPVQYIDLDITYFDMQGISNTNSNLNKAERRKVLEELLPNTILNDYDAYGFTIEQMKRIKRYKFIYWFVYFIERCVFKCEKICYRKTHLTE